MFDCHFAIELDNRANRSQRDRYVDWMRSEADALGVDRVALITRAPHRGETVEACRRDNTLLATLIDEHPDFLHAWAYVHPFQGEPAVREFRRAVEEDGLLGLKWGPLANCADPVADPIAEAAVEMDVPIKIHTAQRTAGKRSDIPQESFSDDTAALAERFPDLTILESHIPCPGDWEYRIKKIAPYENIYLDLSGTNCERGILETMVDRVGAERVVYGSDNVHLACVGKLTGTELSPEDKATIAQNMHRLLAPDDPRRDGDAELAARHEELVERFSSPARVPDDSEAVDANAFVGTWPFREFDTGVDTLIQQLDRHRIDWAMVSALEGATYRNVQPANRRLIERIRGHEDRLIPVATINPTYAAWEDDLQECLVELGMRAVKVLPTHHDYDLDASELAELMDRCAAENVPVLFCASLEDQRGSHPRFSLRGFRNESHGGMRRDTWSADQLRDLTQLLIDCAETDVVIADAGSGAGRILEELDPTVESGIGTGTWERPGATTFVLDDLSMLYVRQGEQIAGDVGPGRLVLGPQLPFKYFDAYGTRVDHLPVSESDRDAIRGGNILDLVDEE